MGCALVVTRRKCRSTARLLELWLCGIVRRRPKDLRCTLQEPCPA
jgi:hypothetical protein